MVWSENGVASFFSSCVGSDHGACGTCRSSFWQAAYQDLSGHSPAYCGQVHQLACGNCLYVEGPASKCGGNQISVDIADHGPGACTATSNHCTGWNYSGRIIDLTPSAFAMVGNLSWGLVGVHIESC